MAPLEITCEDLKEKIEAGLPLRLVDCREPWEHELVRLADSANIPMNDTPGRLTEYQSFDEPTVVYCHHGVRSLHVVNFLRAQGVENVVSLRGGIDAWTMEVDPSLPRY